MFADNESIISPSYIGFNRVLCWERENFKKCSFAFSHSYSFLYGNNISENPIAKENYTSLSPAIYRRMHDGGGMVYFSSGIKQHVNYAHYHRYGK